MEEKDTYPYGILTPEPPDNSAWRIEGSVQEIIGSQEEKDGRKKD